MDIILHGAEKQRQQKNSIIRIIPKRQILKILQALAIEKKISKIESRIILRDNGRAITARKRSGAKIISVDKQAEYQNIEAEPVGSEFHDGQH